jgi:hypothetical protein
MEIYSNAGGYMLKKIISIIFLSLVVSGVCLGQEEKPRLFPIKLNGKIGYIDNTGKIVIPPRFDDGWKFSEGFACVVVNGKTGFINESGEYLVRPQFNSGFGCYSVFREGLAPVSIGDERKNNEKWGFVNTKGEVTYLPGVTLLSEFREGLAPFHRGNGKEDRAGYMDKNLKVVIEPKFKYAGRFYFGRARVTEMDGTEYYIDKTGKKAFDDHHGGEFQDSRAFFEVNGKYGYINTSGQVIIEAQFDDAAHFGEGLAGVEIGEKWGFIDETGKIVIEPQFDSVGEFTEGLASVAVNDKWGFIDKTGNFVILPQFDKRTYYFEGGVCEVHIGSKTGYIDKTGKFIWQPSE